MKTVLILGAKGRFGRAAVAAFLDAGWEVTALARNWCEAATQGVNAVTGSAEDAEALTRHAAGKDVIVNAVNPPYPDWATALPPITRAIIAAAKSSGATVLIPGNVYNYGADAPRLLQETTPWEPTTRKGRLRVEMEEAYRTAGVRTIVLRAGDYIEKAQSGNWFDSQIAAKAGAGKTLYPGPTDQVHAWAYLPDMARAAVQLAERRDSFDPFAEFGFEGYSLTGAELARAIGEAVGKPQKIAGLPWWAVRLIGLFQPVMREVYEMRYLWRVPHRLDGARLKDTLPDFRPTPLADAMAHVLGSASV